MSVAVLIYDNAKRPKIYIGKTKGFTKFCTFEYNNDSPHFISKLPMTALLTDGKCAKSGSTSNK